MCCLLTSDVSNKTERADGVRSGGAGCSFVAADDDHVGGEAAAPALGARLERGRRRERQARARRADGAR